MIYSNLAGTTSNTFQINDGAKFYKNLLPYNLNWQTNSFPDANIHEITTMGLDLNTIKTPGQYYCISRDVINSLVNCPVKDEGFLLTVEPSTGNLSTSLNHVHQCLTSYKGGIWHRWFGSQGEIFIGWVSVAYKSDLYAESGSFNLTSVSASVENSGRTHYIKCGSVIIISFNVSVTVTDKRSVPIRFQGLPFQPYSVQERMFISCEGTVNIGNGTERCLFATINLLSSPNNNNSITLYTATSSGLFMGTSTDSLNLAGTIIYSK